MVYDPADMRDTLTDRERLMLADIEAELLALLPTLRQADADGRQADITIRVAGLRRVKRASVLLA